MHAVPWGQALVAECPVLEGTGSTPSVPQSSASSATAEPSCPTLRIPGKAVSVAGQGSRLSKHVLSCSSLGEQLAQPGTSGDNLLCVTWLDRTETTSCSF